MFSGKSTELLRQVRRHTIAARKTLVLKYKMDTRYAEESMATHDKVTWTAKPLVTLAEARAYASDYDVIGIDEGQFFPDIVPFCEDMANSGKEVIVAALDGTFQRKAFGSIIDLVPLAETITKLAAVCMGCGRDAAFSKRLGSETAVEVIGGADKYVAMCRSCFHSPPQERSSPEPMTNSPMLETAEERIARAQAAIPNTFAAPFATGRAL